MKINVVKIQLVKEGILNVENRQIKCPKDGADIISAYLDKADREYLVLISLNTKNFINNITTVSIGSLNSSIVHPREVFKSLILSNSASFILGHNHPSGNYEPSNEDINITNRLKECGLFMGIDLLDHVIVTDNGYLSFKEKGLL